MNNRKDNRISNDKFAKAEYVITRDGSKVIRNVKPYIQEFKTFAKGRWLGRVVLDVLIREFGGHPKEYWLNAMEKGHVRINDEVVPLDYKFQNSDAFLHRTHRHEPPVFGEVKLVGDLPNVMAVCKPPSLPMHPCGGYRFNSLEYILKNENLIPDQPNLHIIHRLDRVTSGLIVLAKNKDFAGTISKEIRDKETKKVYLARVRGRFPAQLSHMRPLENIDFASVQGEDAEEEEGGAEEGAPSSGNKRKNESVDSNKDGVKEAIKDMEPVDSVVKDRLSFKEQKRAKFEKKQKKLGNTCAESCKTFTSSGGVIDELPPRVRPTLSKEEVGAAANVGYKWEKTSAAVSSSSSSSQASASSDLLWLQCPLIVVSHRDGIHACDPEGKTSISSFRSLGYCEKTDTTLVECNPYTGRTHQLRLHLQFLGNPIANDPCYGGLLFYQDEERKQQARELLREMRRQGSHPLSKVPHFDDPELDGLVQEKVEVEEAVVVAPAGEGMSVIEIVTDKEEMLAQRQGESDNDYLIRTCKYCRDTNVCKDLEHLLHCDGIWLHALRYTGKGWSFETEYPEWAKGFEA